jgi:hypothetical protein
MQKTKTTPAQGRANFELLSKVMVAIKKIRKIYLRKKYFQK